nr:MAG: hypothetical protein [Bacteriophage sp.]
MDKKTYLRERKEIDNKRNDALIRYNQELEKINAEYIRECCPYKIGETIIHDNKVGVIQDITPTEDGRYNYYVQKVGKNGNMTNICFNIFWFDRKPINKVKNAPEQ